MWNENSWEIYEGKLTTLIQLVNIHHTVKQGKQTCHVSIPYTEWGRCNDRLGHLHVARDAVTEAYDDVTTASRLSLAHLLTQTISVTQSSHLPKVDYWMFLFWFWRVHNNAVLIWNANKNTFNQCDVTGAQPTAAGCWSRPWPLPFNYSRYCF